MAQQKSAIINDKLHRGVIHTKSEIEKALKGLEGAALKRELLRLAREAFYVVESKVRTKTEAVDLGLNRYWSGALCKNGHISDRYVKCQGACVQCRRESTKSWKSGRKAA